LHRHWRYSHYDSPALVMNDNNSLFSERGLLYGVSRLMTICRMIRRKHIQHHPSSPFPRSHAVDGGTVRTSPLTLVFNSPAILPFFQIHHGETIFHDTCQCFCGPPNHLLAVVPGTNAVVLPTSRDLFFGRYPSCMNLPPPPYHAWQGGIVRCVPFSQTATQRNRVRMHCVSFSLDYHCTRVAALCLVGSHCA
jgi:hypothetical protein